MFSPVWETCRRPGTLQSCECPPPLSQQDAAGPVCPQQRGFLSTKPLGWVLAEKWVHLGRFEQSPGFVAVLGVQNPSQGDAALLMAWCLVSSRVVLCVWTRMWLLPSSMSWSHGLLTSW